ncbi:MAG: hypothetical protein LBU74_05315 [Methanobacteriaceae archaeon]|jgi:hypothetical protein|nr:hypothetical protein [Candidatus Methanorudis spinitermitis]
MTLNTKIPTAMQQSTHGDLVEWYRRKIGILHKNSGTNSVRFLINEAMEPPCPVALNTTTKVKMTDAAIHVAQIHQSFVTGVMEYQIRLHMPQRYHSIVSQYANNYFKIFIGFKSAIDLMDQYRVFSKGNESGITCQRAIHQHAIQRMIKPRDELMARPNMYTNWEDAHNYEIGKVCGTFITIEEAVRGTTIEIPFCFQFDDIPEFESIDYFCNAISGDLMLEFQANRFGNIVWCMVDPHEVVKMEFNGFQHEGGNEVLSKLNNFYGCYDREFGNAGDSLLLAFPYTTVNDPSEYKFGYTQEYGRLEVLDGRIFSAKSHIYGFRIKDQDMQEIRNMMTNNPIYFPATTTQFHQLSQPPSSAGIAGSTSLPLRNCYNICVLFPRTGNQVTCCKNPGLKGLQISIDGTSTPDKPISTLDPAHVELMLTNAYVADLFAANKEMIESLTTHELKYKYQYGSSSSIMDLKRVPNKSDNTAYCFNIALARLCPGVYTDGYYSSGNAGISLNGNFINGTLEDRYLYNDQHLMNNTPPILIICSVVFLAITVDGVRVVRGDDIKKLFS